MGESWKPFAVWVSRDEGTGKRIVERIEPFHSDNISLLDCTGVIRGEDEMDVYRFLAFEDGIEQRIASELGISKFDMNAILAVGAQK